MVACLPNKDERAGTWHSIPHVSAWGCPTPHGYGLLEGTDPRKVPPETLRCWLWDEDHRTLLSLVEFCWARDQGAQERGQPKVAPYQHAWETMKWLPGIWSLCKITYGLQYIRIRRGGTWNHDIQQDRWHQPVLWTQLVQMDEILFCHRLLP